MLRVAGMKFPLEWSEGSFKVTHLMYADDLVVLCQDLPVAQRVLTLIYDIGKAMGINVSLKKTKLMRLSSRLWENNEGKKIKSALQSHLRVNGSLSGRCENRENGEVLLSRTYDG